MTLRPLLLLSALAATACKTVPTAEASTAGPPPAARQLRFQTSVVRFATAAQARALLEAPDGFTRTLSAFDRQARLGQSGEISPDAFLAFVGQQALEFSDDELSHWAGAFAAVATALEGVPVVLPPEIWVAKTTGAEEFDAPYTRGTTIFLPRSAASERSGTGAGLAAHELFHVLSRASPKVRDACYRLLGFERFGGLTPPAALEARRVTNPDAFEWVHRGAVTTPAGQVKVVPLLVSGLGLPELLRAPHPLAGLRVVLLDATATGAAPPTFEVNETDWTRRLARNTGYAIHPEEVLADNFSISIGARLGARGELSDPALPEQVVGCVRKE